MFLYKMCLSYWVQGFMDISKVETQGVYEENCHVQTNVNKERKFGTIQFGGKSSLASGIPCVRQLAKFESIYFEGQRKLSTKTWTNSM